MPLYLHLLSFFDHVNRKSNHTMSKLCHGSSPNFEEFLSYSSENLIYYGFDALKCLITYVYFVLITDSHVHTVSVVCQTNIAMHNILISYCPISSSDSASPSERKCLSSTYTCLTTRCNVTMYTKDTSSDPFPRGQWWVKFNT